MFLKKISEAFNTLLFSLKSKENLKVLYNKVRIRLTSKEERKNKEYFLNWIKSKCSDYSSLANNISSSLWEESLQFSTQLSEHSNKVLQTIQPKLGGGGIYPFLYFLTRLTMPLRIVETGVAAGFTSQTFLSAIKKNGKGFLYSSDFPYFRINNPEKFIGILVEEELKKYWELHIKGDEINLPVIVNKIPEIDIFHYDSDKTYEGRLYATELIENKMSKNGFIIYDDIQDNAYFYDYVQKRSPQEWYIFEFGGKYIGVIGNLKKFKKEN
ncbi:MAG TPA: class I SAM-dependent methyltransferase [Chitinophagaceae bacterium]|jgi:hypothetical protein